MIILPLRFRVVLIICLFLSAFSLFFIFNNTKDKSAYSTISGKIIYISDKLGELPTRHIGKYRYIKINTYALPFELFIGKDFGDFKPKYERIDNLHLNDIISIYFYETKDDLNSGINRNIQFIDKELQSFYERGTSRKTLGLILIMLNFGLIITSYIAYKKNRIQY